MADTVPFMLTRTAKGLTVSAIGLGAMPMSMWEKQDTTEERSIRTIHAALDAGLTFIDTADAYTASPDMGDNERLVAKALTDWGGDASTVVVATKGGHTRDAQGGWDVDGRPEYLRSAVQRSLRNLGRDVIDLYQHHRPDPAVDYADTIGAVKELLDEGLVAHVGISNADPDQIRLADSILGGRLTSVQNQYSPSFQSSRPELELCDTAGIMFLPWSPLGGVTGAEALGTNHDVFAEVAAGHGVSPQQVALAWELATSPVVVPIPGASRPETILDSIAAADLVLTAEEIVALNAA